MVGGDGVSADAIAEFTGEHRFLSNFYESPVRYLGIVWPTAEHAFQGAKCAHADDRVFIAATHTPGQAKRLGRVVQLVPGWNRRRLLVMEEVVREKFAPGTTLRAGLLATGNRRLVEGNTWHDQFWGDCTCGRPACATTGLNHLGRLLEQVRDAS